MSRRKIKPGEILPYDVACLISALSSEIGRQIGLLISREGEIYAILMGDDHEVLITDLSQFRPIKRGLRGIRLVHTHLKNEPLSEEDLTDLALLRLDLIVAVGVLPNGLPGLVYTAHLLPLNKEGKIYHLDSPLSIHQIGSVSSALLETIYATFDAQERSYATRDRKERALLISASLESRTHQEESLEELAELARSAQLNPIESIVQRPKSLHPKYLLGSGKIKEVVIKALQMQADLLIFNQSLTSLQTKAIGEITEMKVLDRTALILDIFAQRAVTREAQVQVELAQLRYRLPRLHERSTSLSRLTGGIGGRGPGETRLEVDRRRTRDKISRLEKEMETLSQGRSQRRTKRTSQQIPILSIVGYTNAGKSTLLNTLTKSDVKTENLLFSTLDTSTRRLRFPREKEVLLTDTVGFIEALPPDLLDAFQSTLDELKDANLLIHLVDIHSPRFETHIQAVHDILHKLGVEKADRLLVFNKIDLIDKERAENLCKRYGAIGISAQNSEMVSPLLSEIEKRVWQEKGGETPPDPLFS
ncbi:MAG: GTPase HflX [Nitrospirae bacterium]|nr:GTPase HflX [Candidatus Troglogloeales bacterium]